MLYKLDDNNLDILLPCGGSVLCNKSYLLTLLKFNSVYFYKSRYLSFAFIDKVSWIQLFLISYNSDVYFDFSSFFNKPVYFSSPSLFYGKEIVDNFIATNHFTKAHERIFFTRNIINYKSRFADLNLISEFIFSDFLEEDNIKYTFNSLVSLLNTPGVYHFNFHEFVSACNNKSVYIAKNKNNLIVAAKICDLVGLTANDMGIIVDERFRNKSLGTKLTDYALFRASQSGIKYTNAWIDLNNKSSVLIHKKLDFVQTNKKLITYTI